MTVADEAREKDRVNELETALRRTQTQLARAKAKVDDLVDATYQAARDAIAAGRPLPPVPKPPPYERHGKPEVALWDTGDYQLAKVTPSYNSSVCERRIGLYCAKAAKLTNIQRADHRVDEAVLVFGGDIIEGLFQFPTQPFEIDATLFAQWAHGGKIVASVVRSALAVYQKVHVVPEWGNHGRIGSKRDAVPRADNIDRMVYEYARMMLADEKRLTWQDCPEDIQRLEIGNYRALVIHGDEIGRNGYASPGTIVKHINQWASGAYRVVGQKWAFTDAYIHHYHTHAEWPMANGEGAVYQTGSTESDNRYARDMLAAAAIPSQRLHFVDPAKGRVSAQYKVWLP